jgi:hypothetical protein
MTSNLAQEPEVRMNCPFHGLLSPKKPEITPRTGCELQFNAVQVRTNIGNTLGSALAVCTFALRTAANIPLASTPEPANFNRLWEVVISLPLQIFQLMKFEALVCYSPIELRARLQA